MKLLVALLLGLCSLASVAATCTYPAVSGWTTAPITGGPAEVCAQLAVNWGGSGYTFDCVDADGDGNPLAIQSYLNGTPDNTLSFVPTSCEAEPDPESDAESIAWYLGALLLAWAIGFAGGTAHRSFTQLLEKVTSG